MIAAVLAPLVLWIFTGDFLMAESLFVLLAAWHFLKPDEGPPVLATALSFQWLQVALGVFYVFFTKRPLEATLDSDYEPMVRIGLGCIIALAVGLYLGCYLVKRSGKTAHAKVAEVVGQQMALTVPQLLIVYAVSISTVGVLQRFGQDYPTIRQGLVSLTYVRLGLLYLLLRRFVLGSRWDLVGGLLGVEIVLGLTGFYAGFREPLILTALAVLEIFDRRRMRHWVALGAITLGAVVLGTMWVSIRTDYRDRVANDDSFAENRNQRVDMIKASASQWASQDKDALAEDMDKLVDRLWAIYYPALAVARVPSVIPHTDGRLMMETLQHVFAPRVFFPDKPDLKSDSEMVRKYAGVHVAGDEEGTTIAFGYAAESYIDYGAPLMFLPVFIYGLLMGLVYQGIMRTFKYRDMAIAVATTISYLSLYQFERSWSKTAGLAGTLLVYVGSMAYLLDRLWYQRFGPVDASTRPEPAPSLPGPPQRPAAFSHSK